MYFFQLTYYTGWSSKNKDMYKNFVNALKVSNQDFSTDSNKPLDQIKIKKLKNNDNCRI